MTPWEAREMLMERDPQRAIRAETVDPLPPKPQPCTCPDEDKVEISVFGQREPAALVCGGGCR